MEMNSIDSEIVFDGNVNFMLYFDNEIRYNKGVA